MIVIDTNIVAYAHFQGKFTETARKLIDKHRQICLPVLWRHEFLNILYLYYSRREYKLDVLRSYWSETLKRFEKCEHTVDMELALILACEHKITTYDAQFIVLARSLGVSCVTEDKKLIRTFPGLAVSMEEYLS